MSPDTITTPNGNTFKVIAKTKKMHIGYCVFRHNENPSVLRSENVEMKNVNYLGIHFCAYTLPHIKEGIDIPKELNKVFPTMEWMQVNPRYALCTIGVTADVRLLNYKNPQNKDRLKNVLDSFYKFVFVDIFSKSEQQLTDKNTIKKDIRRELLKFLGIGKKKITNWDNELTKLMGEINGKEKKVQ